MDIDIRIGREVEGNGAMLVPPTFKKVSRRHATLHWKDGAVTIEDNESANGTFVNGKRVAKTKLTETDIVWLGGIGADDCYQLDMKKVFASCHDTELKARTDFSKEFETLKKTYVDYQTEVAKLKNSQSIKQRIVNFVPMVVGGAGAIIDLGLGSAGRLVFLGIGIIITLVLLVKNNKHDINEDITELQIKYQKLYKCPKCGKTIPLTTHWKKLEAEGKCPNPKCNAKFVKKENE